MKGEVTVDENKMTNIEMNVAAASGTLSTTTTAMIVWAAVVTLALAAMVVLVFRRLRKTPSWAGGKSDAESAVGASSDVSSEKSSVVDLNDAQQIARDGALNECFESDSVQIDYKHGEVDFDTVDGLYDDGTYGDDAASQVSGDVEGAEVAQSFSRAITQGQGGNSRNLRGLFVPDSKSTF